jgi:HPt (histidine-containing phosphotransfer) domain-containing protein
MMSSTDAVERDAVDSDVVARLERLGTAVGEDLFGDLVVLFLAGAATQVDAMRRAIAINDDEGVESSAHYLSGASSNLGATGLARLCSALEAPGLVGESGRAGAILEAIEVELERVRSAFGSRAPAQ